MRSSTGSVGGSIASAGDHGGGKSDGPDAHDRRARTSSVSFGTISCRSPTTPRSENSKIGRVRVLVDRDDHVRALHADLVLDRARDAERDVELRRARSCPSGRPAPSTDTSPRRRPRASRRPRRRAPARAPRPARTSPARRARGRRRRSRRRPRSTAPAARRAPARPSRPASRSPRARPAASLTSAVPPTSAPRRTRRRGRSPA